MKKVMELRGLIYGKYDSEAALAADLGWSRQRLNKITSGMKEPDLEEVAELAGKLDQSVEDIVQIFLRNKSPKSVANANKAATDTI